MSQAHVEGRLSRPLRDAGVCGEPVMSASQPGPCPPVDRCSKKAVKTIISITFRHPRRGYHVPGLDPQVAPCEADRSCHGCCWALRIPRVYRCTETITSIFAQCSPCRAQIPFPDFPAARGCGRPLSPG